VLNADVTGLFKTHKDFGLVKKYDKTEEFMRHFKAFPSDSEMLNILKHSSSYYYYYYYYY